MLKHGFDMQNIFLSAPGDLEAERDTCRNAISEVNGREAMALKILFVALGLTHDSLIVDYRSAVAENIRQCVYFIQIFEDEWGPKNLFRKMFHLALECRDDPAFPMREVVVFLKAAPRETDPEIITFRKELEDLKDVRVFPFDKLANLQEQVEAVCNAWLPSVLASSTLSRQPE